MAQGNAQIWHASAVAFEGRAALICGASGTGKSALALDLMACGGALVSDDRTVLAIEDGTVWLSAPDAIRGMIEARGVGILRADPVPKAQLAVIVDLDTPETERLPPMRTLSVAGVGVPLLHAVAQGSFPAALRQYLLCGRIE